MAMRKIISAIKRLGIAMRKGLKRVKKRISKERLRKRIKVYRKIVWLERWKKVECAKKRYGVGRISKEVMEVLRELEKGKISHRIVEKIKGKKFVVCLPWLYELSFSKSWKTRELVAIVLGKIGVWNKDVAEMLMRLSRDNWVKESVAYALGEIGVWNKTVAEIFRRLSNDNSEWVRKSVAIALSRMGIWNRDVAEILKELYFSELMKEYIPNDLGKIRIWNNVVGEILKRLSSDGNEYVRKKVALALGNIGVWNDVVAEILDRLSRDEDLGVRESVVGVLGKFAFGKDWEKVQKEFERIEDKRTIVLIGFANGKFDKRKFLKDWKYREELFDLVKAMSVEKLREFVFGKK